MYAIRVGLLETVWRDFSMMVWDDDNLHKEELTELRRVSRDRDVAPAPATVYRSKRARGKFTCDRICWEFPGPLHTTLTMLVCNECKSASNPRLSLLPLHSRTDV